MVLAPAIHGAMTVYINDGARLMEFEETFQSLSDDVDRVNGSLQSIAKRKSSETSKRGPLDYSISQPGVNQTDITSPIDAGEKYYTIGGY